MTTFCETAHRRLSLRGDRRGLRSLCGVALAFGALAPAPLLAETLVGKIVGVTDGDTVKLLVGGRNLYKVRLGEIDAPENGQPFGRASKKMLSDLAFGATVKARVTDVDRYGRSVAVLSRGRTNINAEMVKRGGAWAYRRYLSDQRYLLWEAEAKKARRGLWGLQADQVMPPWDWRAAARAGTVRRATRSTAWGSTYRATTVSQSAPALACGVKWKCGQMSSCEEARYQLHTCGLSRLDGDGDGVPCEKLCT